MTVPVTSQQYLSAEAPSGTSTVAKTISDSSWATFTEVSLKVTVNEDAEAHPGPVPSFTTKFTVSLV